MTGLLFGTACLVGLFAMGRHHRRHAWAHGGGCGGGRFGHGHGYGHGYGRHGRFGEEAQARRGAGFSAAMVEIVKRRLRIDDEQEPFVDHAARDVRDTVKTFHGELESLRADLAVAFRGETVDDAAIDAAFGRLDEAWKVARRELVSAGKQVHAVLDPEQRAVAADALAKGATGAGWVL